MDKIWNSSTLPILLIPMFVATLVVESNVNDECRFLKFWRLAWGSNTVFTIENTEKEMSDDSEEG